MRRGIAVAAALLVWCGLGGPPPAGASHGQPHATISYWPVGADPTIQGFDPHETVEDVEGVTGHVATPEAPLTLVTSMENTVGGFCGPLYWNPRTNDFKTYPVTGGFQAAGDVNRSAPVLSQGGITFQPGDAWFTVHGNSDLSVYVNFRGSDRFRAYAFRYTLLGVRVNQGTGRVYTAGFEDGTINELDPATNVMRTWTIGNAPYWLDVDSSGNVWTAASSAGPGGLPDQVVRLTPATGAVRRWDLPGGGLQPFVSFGMPNGVRLDREGNLWVSQTAIHTVARLVVAANRFDQFAKPGSMVDPNGIASSGSGASLQAFFTERGGQSIDVLTVRDASPVSTTVTPQDATVRPETVSLRFFDFTVQPRRATIPPRTFDAPGADPSGILRFPAPPDASGPAGMSRVAEPQTIYGSFEGSDMLFRLRSPAIIAPPESAASAEGYAARARVNPLALEVERVARSFAGSPGQSEQNAVLAHTAGPASVAVGQTGASAVRSGAAASADGSATAARVDVMGGLVSADLVVARAHAEFDAASHTGSVSSAGSGFVNLVVGGTPVVGSVPPNTVITVPGVATVTLREEVAEVTAAGAALRVNMIHVVSADGSVDVVVSSAGARAGEAPLPG